MSVSQKKRSKAFILLSFLVLSINTYAQFEKLSIKKTSSEFEIDLIEDSTSTYVKIILCGDIVHKQELFKQYASSQAEVSYRSWYRQLKPLLYYPDFVVSSLRSFFPGKAHHTQYENSAPDQFLGELQYTGFNVLMMGNVSALTDKKELNLLTLQKLNAMDIYKAGYYEDSSDKAENYPLVLEKKDIRLGFLNYSLDSTLLLIPQEQINFFSIEKIKKDILKAKDTMLADYLIAYIDWAGQQEGKLGYVAELLNAGVDVIVGTGSGEAFTSADLLSFSDNSLKLHIDNIGYLNAISNERDKNKSALIEIVLQKNKTTKKTILYDVGFLPTWTLLDANRYAVLPISNIEEKYIKNIGLNYVQYSAMKIALTDLRYHFFNKIPELHYDYTDKDVNNVEQTSYIRKTLMRNQDKINNEVKQAANDTYASLFGEAPPSPGTGIIPYEDHWNIYKKKRKVTFEEIEPAQKTKMYGELDEISDAGIVNIKANHKHYQRIIIPPISAEEQARIDSIAAYNNRFLVIDTIAELKKRLKQERQDSIKRRDSIFKANLDPNYKPNVVEVLETSRPYNAYNQQIKSGVYTATQASQSGESVKPIDEYFFVQLYETAKYNPIDLAEYPFLKGYEVRYEGGYYRYLVGKTNSPKLAIEIGKTIYSKGFMDAKIVKYTDGERSIYKSRF